MALGKEVTVLMVDDDDIDRRAFQRSFEKMKISNPLKFARDGLEAFEILRSKEGVSVDRPYLIVLDLNMPRMNGHEFLKELRSDKRLKDSVVFVMTTSSHEEDIAEAYNMNIAGYVVKGDMGSSFAKAVELLDHYWRIIELPS